MSAEDRFVERLREGLAPSPELRVGPGDDAAVVRSAGQDTAYTTDLLVEGVDFLSDEPPQAIGRRAVSVNLSDLAAMGARPAFFLLSIGCPAERGEDYPLALALAAAARGAEFGMVLAGGDLSAAAATVVSVAAWGPLEGPPLLRSGGRPGDWAVVSGFPGRAAAGLWLRRMARSSGLDPEHERELLAAYRDPEPRVMLGRSIAREPRASAAIDVSDGLGMDAARLARASGVRLVLERDRLPVAAALGAFARRERLDPVELVLSGGDDYELFFTVASEDFDALARRAASSAVALTRIGRVEEGDGAVLSGPDGERDVSALGHDHFTVAGRPSS